MKFLLLITMLYAVSNCHAKPDGAPQSACDSLTPKHSGIKAQESLPPYMVKAIKAGNKVKVSITSPIGEKFEGFALQARARSDRTKFVDGEFTTSKEAKATNCFGGKKNTLTQMSPSGKSEIVTEWAPKSDTTEEVIFRATVAKTYDFFWTEIDSEPLKVDTVPQSTSAVTSSEDSSKANAMYDDCFVSKGCFGLPADCARRKDCEVLLTYSRAPDGIQFEMHGFLDSSSYMAMGLSEDNKMGEDTVTECIREGADIFARESWNEGQSNTLTKELTTDRYSTSFVNGLATCSWIRSFNFSHNERVYNFEHKTYYILVAQGKVAGGSLKYHDEKLATSEAVNFTVFEAVKGQGVTDSVKVHGTFMVTAWVGFVSFAILLARHFKNAWEESTLGGVKVWFALHRGFMISGLLFVVVAFIVIFVHKNGWNYSTSNPHAILGCIATGLGLLNPIMAIFRPSPDHPKRPIFNWFHWGVGNSAQIIAVIAIFFAVSLQSSGLGTGFYWVMAVFVIVHLIFHLLYQLHASAQSKKKGNEMDMTELNETTSYNISKAQAGQGSEILGNNFHLFLLNIYTMFVLAILVALYILIGRA